MSISVYIFIFTYIYFKAIFVQLKKYLYILSIFMYCPIIFLTLKMGMLKLVDRPRLGRGEINSYKFESYYP